MTDSNFVLREFHKSEDCIFGESLKVIGKKFKPNSNQNFVKIDGPADCWVFKECLISKCSEIKVSQELKNFKTFGHKVGDGFRKKSNIIVEPEKGYDGPDYKGTDEHGKKAYSHTPAQQYNVKAVDCPCAIGYLDINRQKRTGSIELIKVELTGSFEIKP